MDHKPNHGCVTTHPTSTMIRLRSLIPWLCFAMAICYGQWQTYRQDLMIRGRTDWIRSVETRLGDVQDTYWSNVDHQQWSHRLADSNPSIIVPALGPRKIFAKIVPPE